MSSYGENGFPRIITLDVPSNIKPNRIGDYVSDWTVKTLVEIGPKNYHRNSVSLRALSSHFYILSYFSFQPYAIPQADHIYIEDSSEPSKGVALPGSKSNKSKKVE